MTKQKVERYIQLPNTIIRNRKISNCGKMIFTALMMNRLPEQDRLLFPININGLISITGYIQNTKNPSAFKASIEEMIEFGVIGIYSDFAMEEKCTDLKASTNFFVQFNDEYVYSEEFINQFEEDDIDKKLIGDGFTFTAVFVKDIVKLFSLELNKKVAKANVLAFYMMAISRALIGDKSMKYSTESASVIAHYIDVNRKTVLSYATTLFDARVLFKMTIREITDGGDVRDYNMYTRWNDNKYATLALITEEWFRNKKLIKVGDNDVTEEQVLKLIDEVRKDFGLVA